MKRYFSTFAMIFLGSATAMAEECPRTLTLEQAYAIGKGGVTIAKKKFVPLDQEAFNKRLPDSHQIVTKKMFSPKLRIGGSGVSACYYLYETIAGKPYELIIMEDEAKEAFPVLGLPATATWDQVRKAYKNLSAKLHPDKPGGSNEAFRKLKNAYDTLEKAFGQ